MWDERDGCTVLWAVISEAGKRNILSWNWESVQARAHYFILLLVLVPLIYYSSLQEPVRTGMNDVNGDRQNTKAREEWLVDRSVYGFTELGQKSVDTRNSIRNIVIPQIAITRCQVLLHLFINLLFYSRVPLNTSPPLDPCNASPRVRPNLRKTPR